MKVEPWWTSGQKVYLNVTLGAVDLKNRVLQGRISESPRDEPLRRKPALNHFKVRSRKTLKFF